MRSFGWLAAALGVTLAAAGVGAQGRGAPPSQPPPQQQAQPQKPAPPLVTTGLIVGRVIDAATGRPVAGAAVQIGGGAPAPPPAPVQAGAPRPAATAPAPPPRFLTDGEGRFAFRHLTRGAYSLTATKPGYADGAYGRFRPNGPSRSIVLLDNERVGEITIRVFKYAVITGTVVDETGEPVVGAQLRSFRRVLQAGRRVLSGSSSTTTDDRGIYRFSNLVPGEYVVSLPMVSTSVPVGFNNDGRNQNLQLTMNAPGGGYVGGGGRAITPDGRFLFQVGGPSGSFVSHGSTDASGRVLAYPTQYYSTAATASQATIIKVASGEERTNVDFSMPLVPTASISGMLVGPEGPADNFVLRLVPSDADAMSFDPEVATAVTDQTGAFMFLAVPAGQYVLQTARIPQPQGPPPPPPPPGGSVRTEQRTEANGAITVTTTVLGPTGAVLSTDRRALAPPMLWTAMPVVVGDSNIDGVTLTLRDGYKVSGRVEFSGSAERPPAARLATIPIIVEPADARQLTNFREPGRLNPDGSFTIGGLLPGKYLLRVGGAPGGWTTQSAMLGGVDVSDVPFDLNERDATGVVVTFTDRISDLRGMVRGLKEDREPPAVVIFPSDTQIWRNFGINPRRMRMTRASSTGAFNFGPMPAGDYLIVAIPDEYSTEWNDPAYLDLLSRVAMRLSIGEGERKTQDVEVQDVRPPGGGAPVPAPLAMESLPTSDEHRPRGPYVPEQMPAVPQVRDRTVPDPVGTGSIAGVVIDDVTKRPLRRVRVSARSPEMRSEQVAVTDDQGRFAFSRLAPGPYSLTATKSAYLTGWYGATRPGRGPGVPLPLKEGQAIKDATIGMARGGVISGIVMDQFGQPFSGGRIRLLLVQRRDGERITVQSGGSGTMTTDDRGVYRAYGLMPGTYIVGVMPPNTGGTQEVRVLSDDEMRAALADLARRDVTSGSAQGAAGDATRPVPPAPPGPRPEAPLGGRALNFATVYFPGTVIETDATAVTVESGQELNGIDFTLMLVPTSRVEGSVILPDGQPATRAQLQLWTVMGNSNTTTSVRVLPDGRFQALGVAPGRYTITARLTEAATAPSAPPNFGGATPMPPMPMGAGPGTAYWAQQDLVLNGDDVGGLVLALAPTPSVSGRVVLESRAGTPAPEGPGIRVTLEVFGTARAGASSRSVTADATGTFTITGITPGRYRLSASVPSTTGQPSPWMVRSAVIDGRDVYEQPIDVVSGRNISGAAITVSDQAAELSGSITDAAGTPVVGLQLFLFPTDRTAWSSTSRRMRGSVRLGADGTYRFTNVRPGEYYFAVLAELDSMDMSDPAFLEQVAAAALKLTFTEGEKKVQNLKTGG